MKETLILLLLLKKKCCKFIRRVLQYSNFYMFTNLFNIFHIKIIIMTYIINNVEFMLIITSTKWNMFKSIKYLIQKMKLFENMDD